MLVRSRYLIIDETFEVTFTNFALKILCTRDYSGLFLKTAYKSIIISIKTQI